MNSNPVSGVEFRLLRDQAAYLKNFLPATFKFALRARGAQHG